MRKTKNITVTVSEEIYSIARVWAAKRQTSVSATVEFLLNHMPAVGQAVRDLTEKGYDFESKGRTRI